MRDTFCLPLPELFKRYASLEYIKIEYVILAKARIHTSFAPLDSSLRWNDEWRI